MESASHVAACGEDHERRFVFLKGHFSMPVDHPGMPTRADSAVGAVLLEEGRSITRKDPQAKFEEPPADVHEADLVEDRAHECAVPGPHVGIGGSIGRHDVAVGRRDDGPAPIDVAGHDGQALSDQSLDPARQSFQSPIEFGGQPGGPSPSLFVQDIFDRTPSYGRQQPRHLIEVSACHECVAGVSWAVCYRARLDAEGRVDAALRDRVHAQVAVFGIAPGPFFAVESLDSGRILDEAALVGPSGAKDPVGPFVVDYRIEERVVESRITDVGFGQAEVL